MDLWLHCSILFYAWVRLRQWSEFGEPGGLGGNSLPKALNRKILNDLREDYAAESFLKEEVLDYAVAFGVLTTFAGFTGGVGFAETIGFAGATGSEPRAVTAASRFEVAAATAALAAVLAASFAS